MSLNIYIFSSQEKDPMATILERIAELNTTVVSEKAEIEAAIATLNETQSGLLAKVSELEAQLAEAIAALPNPEEANAAIAALKAEIENIYTPQ